MANRKQKETGLCLLYTAVRPLVAAAYGAAESRDTDRQRQTQTRSYVDIQITHICQDAIHTLNKSQTRKLLKDARAGATAHAASAAVAVIAFAGFAGVAANADADGATAAFATAFAAALDACAAATGGGIAVSLTVLLLRCCWC